MDELHHLCFSRSLDAAIAHDVYSRSPTWDAKRHLETSNVGSARGWRGPEVAQPEVTGVMRRVTCMSVPHPILQMHFLSHEKSSTNSLFSLLKHKCSDEGTGHLLSTLQRRHSSSPSKHFFLFFHPSFLFFLKLLRAIILQYFILKDCLLNVCISKTASKWLPSNIISSIVKFEFHYSGENP